MNNKEAMPSESYKKKLTENLKEMGSSIFMMQ
jgi:hypothetical protein